MNQLIYLNDSLLTPLGLTDSIRPGLSRTKLILYVTAQNTLEKDTECGALNLLSPFKKDAHFLTQLPL